jgi:hypothetical protein
VTRFALHRVELLRLICKRALRNATQRLQRTDRGDVSHFA